MRPKDRFAATSHLVGAIFAMIGTIYLLTETYGFFSKFLVVLVYGFSITFLLLSSGVYHSLVKKDNEESIWRRLDHIAIFVMIAGTYTPISFIYLPKPWWIALLAFQWSLAIAGIIIKIAFVNLGRTLTAGIYLIMGWLAIFVLPILLKKMPLNDFILLLGGGLSFTIGAIFYISEKSSPKFLKLWKHDWFHIFVLVGATMHYFVVTNAII